MLQTAIITTQFINRRRGGRVFKPHCTVLHCLCRVLLGVVLVLTHRPHTWRYCGASLMACTQDLSPLFLGEFDCLCFGLCCVIKFWVGLQLLGRSLLLTNDLGSYVLLSIFKLCSAKSYFVLVFSLIFFSIVYQIATRIAVRCYNYSIV